MEEEIPGVGEGFSLLGYIYDVATVYLFNKRMVQTPNGWTYIMLVTTTYFLRLLSST